jgi:hypothetical protein
VGALPELITRDTGHHPELGWAGPARWPVTSSELWRSDTRSSCPGPGGLLEEETLTYLGQRAKHHTGPDRAQLHAMNLRHLRAMPTEQGDSIE